MAWFRCGGGTFDSSVIKQYGLLSAPTTDLRDWYNSIQIKSLQSEKEYVFYRCWNEGTVPVLNVTSNEATVTLLSTVTYNTFNFAKLYEISGKVGQKYTITDSGTGSVSGGIGFSYYGKKNMETKQLINNWNSSEQVPIIIPEDGEYFVALGSQNGLTFNDATVVFTAKSNNTNQYVGLFYLGNCVANQNIPHYFTKALGFLVKIS